MASRNARPSRSSRAVFPGAPPLVGSALGGLRAAGHEIGLGLTQPDRPSGGGLREKPSAVKILAMEHGLPLIQPQSLRDSAVCARIAGATPEVMVVAVEMVKEKEKERLHVAAYADAVHL